ncbi:MAG: YchF/TatD family DNA exonuclease [Nitrospiraceae bacterium]|nr:YchF/TatD family DNA exonuclease [Nitrospiraceae bacterium]
MIDTHCHLDMDAFSSDREDVIARAKESGIEALISVGSDNKGNLGSLALSKKYDFIYSSVGIHPHDAKDFSGETYNQIKKWGEEYKFSKEIKSDNPKIVAIGETGLDYHYDNSPRDIQKKVFRKHMELAQELDLPVIIHSREAKEDTLKVLRESKLNKGVLHCFSGDRDMAEKVMQMGFYISIAGPVTFGKSKELMEIVKIIPDKYLLIETDSPYLTPEPFRGKRNEPAYIVHTAKKIAELRNIGFEDIERITTLNSKKLFGIGELPEKGEFTYKIRDSLYINVTNRCTNKCSFCVRFHTDYVKGHNLRLSEEPTEDDIKAEVGDPSKYKEIVFCGYGEPLLRLDLVKNLACWVKEKNGSVRINTNGHGNIINKRNILPELKGIVDAVSVSLDAHDASTYNSICSPIFKNAFPEVIEFIKEAKKYIPIVQATVVEIKGVDIEKCKKITEDLGIILRIRKLDAVG